LPSKSNPAIHQYLLSQRELEIIRYMAEGLSSGEIGERFETSPRTVDTQKTRLYEKLGVRNAPQLIQRANDLDLIGKNAY
jgi:DNA-binding CsgD family transcriptional regulator